MRVGIIGENTIEYIEILLNCWNQRKSVVLIDWRIPIKKAFDMLYKIGIHECYVEDCFLDNLDLDNIPFKIHTYHSSHSNIVELPAVIKNLYIPNESNDEAIVIFTSGTTGRHKGVRLTHFAITHNARSIIKYNHFDENTRLLINKPLCCSSAIVGELLTGLISNAKIYIGKSVWFLSQIFESIYVNRINTICTNPHTLSLYLNYFLSNDKNQMKFNSVQYIYVSGSCLSQGLIDLARKKLTGVHIFNMYGLTEAGPRISSQTKDNCNNNSVGVPINNVDVKVFNDNKEAAMSYQKGNIYIKTPSLFIGYADGPEVTSQLFNGYLKTGDIGYFDNKGELYICGRSDDALLINSNLIFPQDIENIIQSYDKIKECIVIECNSELICYYTSEIDILFSEIYEFCASQLPLYEVPKKYIRLNEFPRTSSGKIKRIELKKGYI